MDTVIKVLQINSNTKDYGGVSALLFNVYKNIDKSKVQFDFLSPNKTTYEIHRKEIEKMGGHLYGLGVNANGITKKILIHKKFNEFLQKNKYDVVHINSGSFIFNLQIARIAKKNKVQRIIIHSHNTLNKKNKIKNLIIKLLRPLLSYYATDFFACSQKAAYAMFPKKVAENTVIIKNGINVERFKFNIEIREKIQKKLNIQDKFVIGHVGRFVSQKNHKFIIECFNEVYKKNKNAVLLLIGEGELEAEIKNKVSELKLEENIKFLGLRKDVNEIMQAMDIFLLPSLFEGLPIVGIEAQAAGLKCIMSDTITEEVNITNRVTFLSLEKNSLKEWATEILKENKLDRNDGYKEIIDNGYSIESTSNMLLKIYTNYKK